MFKEPIHDSAGGEIIFHPLQFVIIFRNPNEPCALSFSFKKFLVYSEKFQ